MNNGHILHLLAPAATACLQKCFMVLTLISLGNFWDHEAHEAFLI
jgi:hypothetical protein